MQEKLQQVYKVIDAYNQKDPNSVTFEGKEYPKELIYGQQMTAYLEKFEPEASEVLKIAARAQHIGRWESPRDSYPMDKVGYFKWRNDLKKHHAEVTGKILEDLAYDTETIERVQFLLQKKNLKKDAETQILEDVICLVFLDYYIDDFAAQHADYTEEKWIGILQKTWKKMSVKGHDYALRIVYSPAILGLIKKAIAEEQE